MKVRWGIIGCGAVCEVKSGPALYKCADSELVIVMRRDRARAADFARRHGVANFSDDARAVVEDPRVNAVYVATPPGSHLEYALATAAAGKPCYVEKPMARNARECHRMVETFEAKGLPLFVAYYRRALPRFTRVRQLLEQGRLGVVRSVSHVYQGRARSENQPGTGPPLAGWREEVANAGGGLFVDLGSHVVDLIDFLCGPLDNVQGHAARRARPPGLAIVEDTVAAAFATQSGALGTLMYSFHTAKAVDRMEIVGDRGRLVFSVFGTEPIQGYFEHGPETLVPPHPEHMQQPLVQAIVDELLKRGPGCPSTARTALRASAVMDRILSGYYGGRDDDFWNRPSSWPGNRP
jgi:1,5-anhydro-D-fructose reductase (1,5-anhydro-D-mannitol-forming)